MAKVRKKGVCQGPSRGVPAGRTGANGVVSNLAAWVAARFHRIERLGPPVPPGPALVVANHPNSLLDPLIVFHVGGRPIRPLAKAPLFDQVIVGLILRSLGGLPVYRRQDDPGLMSRNEDTFRAAVAALTAGDAVLVFPEGRSHSEPSLVPLRTGAARIALRAEAGLGWRLGLKIVPVGITYSEKTLFSSRALAAVGEPFTASAFQELHEADPQEAARALTREIADRLEVVTLSLSRAEDRTLVEVAERVYVREKESAGWRERDGLADRLPRLQKFSEGLAWLRAHDPARHRRLAAAVERYGSLARRLGAEEADVPPGYPVYSVFRYALRELFWLILGALPALLGAALWFFPCQLPRLVVLAVRPSRETVATTKLAAGLAIMPLWAAGSTAVGWRLWGMVGAVAAAALLPLLGATTLRWRARWGRVREDALLFLRLLSSPHLQRRLAAERSRLVAEFDDVRRAMERDHGEGEARR